MTNADFVAGYHAGYQAAVEHLNAVPGLVLPGNVAAILGDDTRRTGLAESAAAEHAATVAPDAVLDGATGAITVDGVIVSPGKTEETETGANEADKVTTPED